MAFERWRLPMWPFGHMVSDTSSTDTELSRAELEVTPFECEVEFETFSNRELWDSD